MLKNLAKGLPLLLIALGMGIFGQASKASAQGNYYRSDYRYTQSYNYNRDNRYDRDDRYNHHDRYDRDMRYRYNYRHNRHHYNFRSPSVIVIIIGYDDYGYYDRYGYHYYDQYYRMHGGQKDYAWKWNGDRWVLSDNNYYYNPDDWSDQYGYRHQLYESDYGTVYSRMMQYR